MTFKSEPEFEQALIDLLLKKGWQDVIKLGRDSFPKQPRN